LAWRFPDLGVSGVSDTPLTPKSGHYHAKSHRAEILSFLPWL